MAETGPNSEQRRWEEEHLHAALLKFGARDAKTASEVRLILHVCVQLTVERFSTQTTAAGTDLRLLQTISKISSTWRPKHLMALLNL